MQTCVLNDVYTFMCTCKYVCFTKYERKKNVIRIMLCLIFISFYLRHSGLWHFKKKVACLNLMSLDSSVCKVFFGKNGKWWCINKGWQFQSWITRSEIATEGLFLWGFPKKTIRGDTINIEKRSQCLIYVYLYNLCSWIPVLHVCFTCI